MDFEKLEHQVEVYLYHLHRRTQSCKTRDAREARTRLRRRARLELEAFLKWLEGDKK